MRKYFNVNNYQTNNDRLRGHLGNFPAITGSVSYRDNKITNEVIEPPVIHKNKIFPSITQKVFVYSDENVFRDGAQWRAHINSLIQPNLYVDHSFATNIRSTECNFHRLRHIPEYEDFCKGLDTRELLNYNIAYTTSDSELINDMATLRNTFDGDLFYGDFGAKGNNKHLQTVIDNYDRRLALSEVGRRNIVAKNQNIYIMNKTKSSRIKLKDPIFPCNVKITSNNHILHNNELLDIFEEYNYEKLIFQAINNNSPSQIIEFQGASMIKAYDLIELFSNLDFKNFQEKENELFLLNENDKVDNLVNRFVNQINTIKVLEKINNLIQENLRDYNKIINTDLCKRYNLGYKIEKYINNDNGAPIQTYYIKNDENHLEHIDTQLKFGTKYFYKVYNISCVMGNSYTYENIDISSFDDENEFLNENYDTTHAYRASATVSIAPSIKILEIPIHSSAKMFFDLVPPKPWVEISLSSKGVMIDLEPMGYNNLEKFEYKPIHPDEAYVRENLAMASDGFAENDRSTEYFNGTYMIYRLTEPPKSMEDFYTAPSKRVEGHMEIIQNNKVDQTSQPQKKVKMLYLSHDDKILSNRKYYYIFRAVSHHGTLSNPSDIYEVEVVKTASDKLLNVNLYEFKTHKRHKKTKDFKRLLKIEPSFFHIQFPWSVDAGNVEDALDIMAAPGDGGHRSVADISSTEALDTIGDAGKKLFSELGNKFKIRLTSKHTGKKIDLNVNFKIIKKTN